MSGSKIIATGAYIPTVDVPNQSFISQSFFDPYHHVIEQPAETVIQKFSTINGRHERLL